MRSTAAHLRARTTSLDGVVRPGSCLPGTCVAASPEVPDRPLLGASLIALALARMAHADAPTPGNESGRTDTVDDGDSTLRQIARGVLYVLSALAVLDPIGNRRPIWR